MGQVVSTCITNLCPTETDKPVAELKLIHEPSHYNHHRQHQPHTAPSTAAQPQATSCTTSQQHSLTQPSQPRTSQHTTSSHKSSSAAKTARYRTFDPEPRVPLVSRNFEPSDAPEPVDGQLRSPPRRASAEEGHCSAVHRASSYGEVGDISPDSVIAADSPAPRKLDKDDHVEHVHVVLPGAGPSNEGITPPPPPPPPPPPGGSSSAPLAHAVLPVPASVRVHSRTSSVRLLSHALNKNRVSDYEWIAPLLLAIVQGRAEPVRDLSTGVAGAPMFVVAGACPNPFCGMQAVMYSMMQTAPTTAIDFWWIKPVSTRSSAPSTRAPPELERATLQRHHRGEFKNDPGRSRALYAQFADLFSVGDDKAATARSSKAGGGLLRFEVRQLAPGRPRASIVDEASGTRYWIYLIWQEDWTSNPLSRTKYIKGKLVYQREHDEARFYARPYAYRDGVLSVPSGADLEEEVPQSLPPDSIQRGCLEG